MSMACRCEDLEMMKRDVARLSEAREKLKKLAGLDMEVDACLSEVGAAMDETLMAPQDDLTKKIGSQNADTTDGITGMDAELGSLEESLIADIESATAEDSEYHLGTFIGNLQSMFGSI